jgi:hypothetical protein
MPDPWLFVLLINTNYQLPNGLIKVRRRWGQRHPQGANSGSNGKLKLMLNSKQLPIISLIISAIRQTYASKATSHLQHISIILQSKVLVCCVPALVPAYLTDPALHPLDYRTFSPPWLTMTPLTSFSQLRHNLSAPYSLWTCIHRTILHSTYGNGSPGRC